jgi:transcriptional regulator with XRE-family HTH domain
MTPNDLRNARKAMGYTQHSLADALRMGKSGWQTISDWERDVRPIPGPVQIAVEHLLNCSTIQDRAYRRMKGKQNG